VAERVDPRGRVGRERRERREDHARGAEHHRERARPHDADAEGARRLVARPGRDGDPVGRPPGDLRRLERRREDRRVEVEGVAEWTRELRAAVREGLQDNQGDALREAQTPAERDLLWAGRKGAIGALGRIKPNYYLHDGVVPRSRLPQVLSAVGEIGEHYKLPVANVFHAGDGNLHPNILFDLRDRDVLRQVEGAGEEMLRAVVELGGALSGEHGIGLEKSAFMPWVFSPDDLDAMQRVKRALDADGILNPGKIFPDPSRKHVHLAGRTGLAIEAKWW